MNQLPVRMVGSMQDITERKQTEEALRRSEALFRTLINSSWDAFHLIAPDGRITYESPAVKRLLGYEPEEMIGRNAVEFVHPHDLEEIMAGGMALMDSPGAMRTVILRVRHKNGSWRWVESFEVNLVNHPDVGAVAVNYHDITERKQAEESLQKSEHEQRHLAEQLEMEKSRLVAAQQVAKIGSWETDLTTMSINWSAESHLIFETDPATFHPSYREFLELVHPEDRASVDEALVHSLDQRARTQIEHRLLLPDGRIKFVEERWQVSFDEEDKPARAVGTCQDITERKALETERDRFFSLSLDMLAIVGSEGYFKRLNPAFEATLGFSNAELMAVPFLEFVHPDDIADTLTEMEKLNSGVQVLRFENRYRCRDGSYKWLRWMSAPYGDLWYCVAHDITGEKSTAAALHKANDELELRVSERTKQLAAVNEALRIENIERKTVFGALQETADALLVAKQEADAANRAKSEFLSRMSHELRTPLNAILGFGQILEKDDMPPKRREHVQHILKGGRHLLELINEVLDISRIEIGHLALSIGPVPVGLTVREVLAIVRPLTTEGNVQLINEIPPHDDWYMSADRQRLNQILLNLISNAIKYNRDGGRVTVSAEEISGGVVPVVAGEQRRVLRLSIRDTGNGLSEEDIGKLFVPFERLGAAKTRIEGSGIGLVLSKRLVEAMGGKIGVRSTLGQGSTFWIELPLVPNPLRRAQEQETSDRESVIAPEGERKTVLCIEGNLANLQVIETVLAEWPHVRLLTAMQGSTGLDVAFAESPDLILLDLHLPDINGDEVLRRLQTNADTSGIPVVMISADAMPSQIESLLAAGAKKYLTKPLNVKEFISVVDETLQGKE